MIDIIPAHDIENMNMEDVDAVISTISLEGKGIEYIQVDPLLTDEDCIRVGEKLSKIHPKVSEKKPFRRKPRFIKIFGKDQRHFGRG